MLIGVSVVWRALVARPGAVRCSRGSMDKRAGKIKYAEIKSFCHTAE
jgi:hypothetical protein